MKVLLSIKPEYVQKIFNGEKKFEYRKSIFTNKAIKSVVVYCTMPVGRIVGEFSIEEILLDSPEVIWKETKENAGVQKDFFMQYFYGRQTAYAIKIGTTRLYKKPIDPKKRDRSFVPPQSFRYII
ncbi:ASCH domain-containing protein [Pseudoflavitalea rhizosphaerae]|uniref:ASCH domain-containing protein n=1 Tax=Pseudoflavitalea rhizosphaerae TaxID=1884793 RepID=UPI000F8DF98F|nr:ASCH domain-containing protein [Pseudoflavitalea rhizosphaerae]